MSTNYRAHLLKYKTEPMPEDKLKDFVKCFLDLVDAFEKIEKEIKSLKSEVRHLQSQVMG